MNEHDYIAKTFHLLYGAGDLPYMTLSSRISYTVSRQSGEIIVDGDFYVSLHVDMHDGPMGLDPRSNKQQLNY